MKITKEQWEKIETELSHSFGNVTLKCDSYEVTLQVVRVDSLQYGIQVYVNGFVKGKWIMEDCEERRRFLRPVERFVFSAKQRIAMIKVFGGKRAPKNEIEHINRKITFYQTYWTSVKSLRRHLEKHNSELELVSICGLPVAKVESPQELPAELATA